MSQSKERLLELNAQLAQTLTEKGVEATADETTTALVDKVAEISGDGGLPDWDDDSPIIANDRSYVTENVIWELTEKGTFRWKIIDINAGGSNSLYAWIGDSALLSSVPLYYQQYCTKIKQIYVPDGIKEVEFLYAINCERIRTPNTLIKCPRWAAMTNIKEVDCDSEAYSTLKDYNFAKSYSLEKVKLYSGLTIIPRNTFEDCYLLRDINLENVTTFGIACFRNDFSLKKDIIFSPDLKSIADNAFQYTRIKSVTFQPPNGDFPTIANTAFNNCRNLTEVNLFEGWNMSLYVRSANLTQASLHDMIEKYADMTGQTSPVMNVGSSNLAKIDDEHKAMATAKNITLA